MTLEKLFDAVYDEKIILNPFFTFEINKQQDKVCNMLIEPIKDYDKSVEADDELNKLIMMAQQQAFKVGLKTALDIAHISLS